jgi:hypothetical protein
MTLVKLSLESKGIYVNHKPTASQQFIKEFREISDATVITELQQLWNDWHQKTPAYSDGQILLKRVVLVAEKMDEKMKKTESIN